MLLAEIKQSRMFDIIDSRDFYAMLVNDFDDFMDNQSSARHAFHCAVTAYHLYEWVWGNWLKTDYECWEKLGGIRDKKDFLSWVKQKCPWFEFVEDLANGSKHFVRDQSFESSRIVGYGQGPYGIGPYSSSYLLIDFREDAGEHRYYDAATLLEVVLRFWRDFFRKYRPTHDLPVSKHHVD